MHIVIFGSTKPWAIEVIYEKYLKEMGNEISIFDPTLYYRVTNIFHNILYKYLKVIFFLDVNNKFLKYISNKKPDIVWIFKGLELSTHTLIKLKKLNVKLVNFNPDHPFLRTYSSSGGKNIENAIPLYDLHFTYSSRIANQITYKFNIPVEMLPFGFELPVSIYQSAINQKEIVKLCFVGNPDSIRISLVKKIISHNISIDLYGYGWEKNFLNHPLVTCYGPASTVELYDVLRKYRIQLNIFRPHNYDSHNMRTFEIAGVGGIQLAPDSHDHRRYFSNNVNIFLYKNEQELIEKIFHLLELPHYEVSVIRNNVRNHSLIKDYSYLNRAYTVNTTFYKLINK
jgi:spore maturation protein CgeB